MSIIFITKCLLIYFSLTYRKNLVESSDTSATSNPGTGTQGGTAVTTTAGGTNSGSKTGVELSLKAKNGTDQFNRTENIKVVTYTAKDNYGFKSVKTGDKSVWETKDNKYADKVILYGKGKKSKSVTINIPNGSNMAYVRNGKGEPWQEYDLSKTNPVSLNLRVYSDSCIYIYKEENNIKTFTANPGFVFKEVICEYVQGGKYVWKTTNENEYANKVELEGTRKAKIHFKDGSVKVFKYGCMNVWYEDTHCSKKGNGTEDSGGGAKPADGSSPGTKPSTQ